MAARNTFLDRGLSVEGSRLGCSKSVSDQSQAVLPAAGMLRCSTASGNHSLLLSGQKVHGAVIVNSCFTASVPKCSHRDSDSFFLSRTSFGTLLLPPHRLSATIETLNSSSLGEKVCDRSGACVAASRSDRMLHHRLHLAFGSYSQPYSDSKGSKIV